MGISAIGRMATQRSGRLVEHRPSRGELEGEREGASCGRGRGRRVDEEDHGCGAYARQQSPAQSGGDYIQARWNGDEGAVRRHHDADGTRDGESCPWSGPDASRAERDDGSAGASYGDDDNESAPCIRRHDCTPRQPPYNVVSSASALRRDDGSPRRIYLCANDTGLHRPD